MSKYKLVCSDLDGTLLLKDMTVSPENKRAIREMTDLGTAFVVSSGRAFTGMPEDVLSSDEIRYVISSNGAMTYDKLQKRTILSSFTEKELSAKMFDLIDEYDTLLLAHYGGVMHMGRECFSDEVYEYYNVNRYYSDFIDRTGEPVENHRELFRSVDDLEMITLFFHDEDELKECSARLEETGDLIVVSSARGNLEVFSKKAGKGNALAALAHHLGIPTDATIAVGDSTNDLPMLRAAGLSLAMDNAFPEVKAEADAVICRFDEHSAEYILNNFIK